LKVQDHLAGKLLQQFAGLHSLKVTGNQIAGPNGRIIERIHEGKPILAYLSNSERAPALMFLHDSPEHCEDVLKAIGLWTTVKHNANGATTLVSRYAALDGKVTVRRCKQNDTYEVLVWEDGVPECAFASHTKRVALKRAKFIREQFRELEKV
jgi:hypothetical protein